MTSQTTDGGRAGEPFIRVFERVRRRSTMAIYSMEESNFFKIS
jgi:hypothetical protein